jgi:hypothetical protein
MIIGSNFDGDVDKQLMLDQADVFRPAVRVIVTKCDQMAAFARNLLADEIHIGWGENDSYNLSGLRRAHDLIAAAWRYRFAPSDRVFPFAEKNPEFSADYSQMHGWLHWLNEEVDGWIESPHLVRSVQVILTHPIDDVRFQADRDLFVDLVRHFYDVPWNEEVRNECQRSSIQRFCAKF